MDKSIGILDKDYALWVKELVKRYRDGQIKMPEKLPQLVEILQTD